MDVTRVFGGTVFFEDLGRWDFRVGLGWVSPGAMKINFWTSCSIFSVGVVLHSALRLVASSRFTSLC